MRALYFHELGGVLAAPARRSRRLGVACAAAVVLLAVAGLIVALRLPPDGLLASLSGPGGQTEISAVFSPDGKTLAVVTTSDPPDGGPGSVSLWDVAARRWTATLTDSGCQGSQSAAYSPDGRTLALFGRNNAICLFDLATGQQTTLDYPGSGTEGTETRGAFVPGGTTLAVAADTGVIYLFDLATRRLTATLADPANNDGCESDEYEVKEPYSCAAFSPDGSMLAVSGSGQTDLWDLATRRLTGTLTDPGDSAASAGGTPDADSPAFGPDGMLAAGDPDGTVYLWDVASRKVTASIAPPFDQGAGVAVNSDNAEDYDPFPASWTDTEGVLSPDGKILAADAVFGHGTYLYDVASGKLLSTLTDPGASTSSLPAVAFSPDGSMLAVVDGNGHVYLWSAPTLAARA
jgi:WD40 repeat protein